MRADAWLVYDVGAGCLIASHGDTEPRPMASTTKLMTALLVLEYATPDDEVVISRRAQATNHKQVYLRAGDRWEVEELLEAMIVVSANDAAVALAEHVGGDVETFVDMMNVRARLLSLTDTSYANPHGLDASGHVTTARDLLLLSRTLMGFPAFARLAAQQEALLTTPDGSTRRWDSTNELLSAVPGVVGVKTGRTRGAGDVLSAAADRGGRRMYAIAMGSSDANADVRALLDYGFAVAAPERRVVPPLRSDLDLCSGSYTGAMENARE